MKRSGLLLATLVGGLAVAGCGSGAKQTAQYTTSAPATATRAVTPAGTPPNAARPFPACKSTQIGLSVKTGVPFTGGTQNLYVVLRNTGKAQCSVEGHPRVVVAPQAFPIVVGDLASFDRNDPSVGPERVLDVRPAGRAQAEVVIRRLCDGAKKEMRPATVVLAIPGPSAKTVPLRIRACRRKGVEIDTGPLLPYHP